MDDPVTTFLDRFLKSLNSVSEIDDQVVVKDSKQITGTPKDQMLSLSQRLAPDERGAEVRRQLESTKADEATPEDDELDEEMIQMWADDIINKHLEDLFKD